MAEAIQTQSVKVASEAVTGDGSNAGDQPFLEAKGTESDKVKDLHRDMIDVYSSRSMTTDFGQKIHRFDHERILERVVHARGAAAFGKFTLLESAEDVTFAPVLTDTSRETPVFLRFSTVQGSRGSADTVRDVRGFAVKFYTQEGNWDIVGNNIPVFFIQDSVKFPDIVHAVKPEPHNDVPQGQSAHNNFWDFVYMHPEATHMHAWTMSDRAIPRSFRMMQGFSVNTYCLINSKSERSFVKFIFTPELGVHSLVWDEALKLAGQDPDFHRRDLWEAIENGAPPKWKFGIQVIPEADEHNFDFDILDATKVWPEELVPIRYLGELELNRNPDNFFCEVEQAAFCTSHIIPGIDFSDDPLLQGRNFSYFDTQITRLGINWEELPINRPVCPVMNNHRDGGMRHIIHRGTVNYWPNRFEANPPAKKGGFVSYPAKESGIKARMVSDKFKDYLTQAQLFYNSLSPIEKLHQKNAYSFELGHCDDPVVYNRMAERLAEIDLSLAQGVAEKVGAPVPEKQAKPNHGKKAKGLSQLEFMPEKPTIKSRRVAILIADGYDPISYGSVSAAVRAQGAFPFVVAPKRQKVLASNSESVQPDHTFAAMRSTMFDAVFIPDGKHAETLRKNGLARYWVREAFGHNKAIGAVGTGILLVEDAVREAEGVKLAGLSNSDVTESYGIVTVGRVEESSMKKPVEILKQGKGFIDQFFFQISQHRCWQRELDGLSDMVSC